MSRLITILLCLSMSLLFGCGQPKQDSTSPAASAPAEASDPSAEKLNSAVAIQEPAVQKMDTLSPTTTTASATRPIDGTAESAFHNTLMAFQEGQLEQVLNFLPQSYQSDLEQLVHQFAEQFDDDVWASGIALIGRFGQVMSTKKSMILGMDLVKNSPYAKQLATDWDQIANGLVQFSGSNSAKVAYLKTCSIRELLSNATPLIAKLPLPKFNDVSVTTIEFTDDTALLSYQDLPNSEPRQVEFVKIEGKWLPKSLVAEWPDSMKALRTQIASIADGIRIRKEAILKQFESNNSSLSKMIQASNSDEFGQGFFPLVFNLRLQFMNWQNELAAGPNYSSGGTIYIEINRELSDKDQTRLKDSILEKFPETPIEYEIVANDGKTRCRFVPISDDSLVLELLKMQFTDAEIRLPKKDESSGEQSAPVQTIHVQLK